MVEEGRPCMDLVRQTQALQGSLNTATVEILSSRHARITRNAISPRLATSTRRIRRWVITPLNARAR